MIKKRLWSVAAPSKYKTPLKKRGADEYARINQTAYLLQLLTPHLKEILGGFLFFYKEFSYEKKVH